MSTAAEPLNDAEYSLVYAALGTGSSFVEALMYLCCTCDQGNLARLERAFPEYVAAWKAWYDGDLIDRAMAAGLTPDRYRLVAPSWGRRKEQTT